MLEIVRQETPPARDVFVNLSDIDARLFVWQNWQKRHHNPRRQIDILHVEKRSAQNRKASFTVAWMDERQSWRRFAIRSGSPF